MLKILSVMDPLDQLSIDQDTTIGFLKSAFERNHQLWICCPNDLYLHHTQTWVKAVSVSFNDHGELLIGTSQELDLSTLSCIWMRKDPPVDQAYLHACYLLDYAHTWVINPARAVIQFNEKLYALEFPHLTPSTRLSTSVDQVTQWLEESERPLIVKPLDGFGGLGIFLLSSEDRNARSTLELLTDHGRRWVIVQEYLPQARIGDKRVIVIDGEVIGAILRTPQKNDHRGNIHVGGQVSSTELTFEENQVCIEVALRLKQDGIFFAGLDLIGGYLTEINITSPTGIRELKELNGIDAGARFIEAIETRCKVQKA